LLTQKQDAAFRGPIYTYDELGRLKTRVLARGITCIYSYDPNTGELRTITYSDSTPAVSITYDRGGRQTNISDAAGSRVRTFNLAGQLQTEQITGGLLDGAGITVGYDSFLRRNSLQSSHNANILSNQIYGYDTSSRLQTVTSGSFTASYAYYPNSGLLNTTTFTGGTSTSRSYDAIGRLESITTTPAADIARSYTYNYNNLNQRTRVTREDGSYWSYIYNDRGELISGKKYWSDNSIIWGAQTEYNFDNLGNRISAKNGGNQLGTLRQSTYNVNSLNQYSQRIVSGALDIAGTANSVATVTVNNQSTSRKGVYFYRELTVDNSTSPVSVQLNIVGARNNFGAGGEDAISEKGGRAFIPPATEALSYDFDGNVTSDGHWSYTWDGENRLVGLESVAGVPAAAKSRLEFSYDYLGRRIRKAVYTWDIGSTSYQLQSIVKFVYDGWSLLAELDANNALLRSYSWGRGQPLLVNEPGDSYLAGHDGSSNLIALVRSNTGIVSAEYDFDPFGNTLRATGDSASNNPLRFADQYEDKETGLLYHGHRFYSPLVGRWISRDPAEESGGLNLYAFTANDSVNQVDVRGLFAVKVTADAWIPWDWVKIPNPVPLARDAIYIHGDGRGPGNPWNEAYRMISWVEFDFPTKVRDNIGKKAVIYESNQPSIRQVRSWISGGVLTYRDSGPFKGNSGIWRLGDCEVGIRLSASGSVPWLVAGPQPAIDYKYQISLLRKIKKGPDQVIATIKAEHDGFPGHELFLEYNGKVVHHKYYMPLWFASEPPGQTAYPGLKQSVDGARALAGELYYQKWTETVTHTVNDARRRH